MATCEKTILELYDPLGVIADNDLIVIQKNGGATISVSGSVFKSYVSEAKGAILYISTEGNDVSAELGDDHFPYAKPVIAAQNASSGDLLYVYNGTFAFDAGDYDGGNELNHSLAFAGNINLQLEPGVTLSLPLYTVLAPLINDGHPGSEATRLINMKGFGSTIAGTASNNTLEAYLVRMIATGSIFRGKLGKVTNTGDLAGGVYFACKEVDLEAELIQCSGRVIRTEMPPLAVQAYQDREHKYKLANVVRNVTGGTNYDSILLSFQHSTFAVSNSYFNYEIENFALSGNRSNVFGFLFNTATNCHVNVKGKRIVDISGGAAAPIPTLGGVPGNDGAFRIIGTGASPGFTGRTIEIDLEDFYSLYQIGIVFYNFTLTNAKIIVNCKNFVTANNPCIWITGLSLVNSHIIFEGDFESGRGSCIVVGTNTIDANSSIMFSGTYRSTQASAIPVQTRSKVAFNNTAKLMNDKTGAPVSSDVSNTEVVFYTGAKANSQQAMVNIDPKVDFLTQNNDVI